MYNLFTIDAPFFYIDNEEGLIEEAEKVKNLGFTGKAAIHPSQIDFINDAFEPTKEEKESQKVREYQKMDGGAVKIDGKMVDEPIAEAMRLKLSLEIRTGGLACQVQQDLGKNRFRESFGHYFEEFEVGHIYEHRPGRPLPNRTI